MALAASRLDHSVEAAATAVLDDVGDDVFRCRFADQAVVEFLAVGDDRGEEAAGAVEAGAFLVAGDQQGDRSPGRAMVAHQARCSDDEGGDGALHVGGAAAVEDAVPDLGAERIGGPAGGVAHGHDIRMASETEVRGRGPKPRIEVIDALEGIAPGAEAERFQGAGQQILRAVVAGVHGRLADKGLGEGHGIVEMLGHGGGFSAGFRCREGTPNVRDLAGSACSRRLWAGNTGVGLSQETGKPAGTRGQ